MSAPYVFPYVPNARPAPIDKKLLTHLRGISRDLVNNQATLAEVEWLGACLPTLLDELDARRDAMEDPDAIAQAQIIQIVGR